MKLKEKNGGTEMELNKKENIIFALEGNYPCQYQLETIVTSKNTMGSLVENKTRCRFKIYFSGKIGEFYRFQLLMLEIKEPQGSTEYNLSIKVAHIFSDIRITMNEKGEIIKLNNLKKIKNSWEEKRKELEKINKGSSVQNFFNSISILLEDEQKTIKYLLDYYRYGMFFNGTILGSISQSFENRRTMGVLDRLVESEVEEIWRREYTEPEEESIFTVYSQEADTDNKLSLYKGKFYYTNNNLVEGCIEIKYTNINIKHSVLWVG